MLEGRSGGSGGDASSEEEADAKDARRVASRILSELCSEDEARLIQAVYWKGLTEEAAAAELGISRRTLHRKLDRLLERLRHALEAREWYLFFHSL
jgi:RNA polymerase sigma factor (sigma-70 family)